MPAPSRVLSLGLGLGILLLSACATHNNNTGQQPATSTVQIASADFFNQSGISELQLSSDGQWLAWLQQVNGISNIYVMPVNGSAADAYPLTQFKEPIDGFQWSLQGKDIFYSQDFGGNENQQISLLRLSGKNRLKVEEDTRLTTQDNSNYQFVAQNKAANDTISYLANHDDPARVDLYQLNLSTGQQTLVMENKLSFMGLMLDDSGQPKVGVTMHSDSSYELYAFDQGQWKGLFRSAPGESISLIEYSPKRNLAYISTSMGALDKLSLLSVDLKTGKTAMVHEDPNQRSDVYATQFDKQGNPLMVSYYYGHKEDHSLEPEFARHWKAIQSHFPHKVEIDLLEHNTDSGKWLLSVASDRDAGGYYFYDQTNGEVKRLLQKDTGLDPAQLSPRQSITYQARDGETIQAYLTLPKGQNKNLPTIVIPHGGPWARDYWTLDSGYFNRIAQLLANRGYAVLQPNFRASTGFGERFYNLGNQNWGTGSMQDDVSDGAQYLIDQGIANPKKIGIMGGSYGGYAALAGVTYTPELYNAAISFCGPSSLVTLMNSFPDYYRPYLGNWFTAVGDPLIPADVEKMEARSPINFVERIRTPLLLVQGANDPRVTQQESDNIAVRLHQQGRNVEYILAKDEGHGFQKHDNKLAFILKMEAFFAQHLGGKTDPAPTQAIQQHLKGLEVDIDTL